MKRIKESICIYIEKGVHQIVKGSIKGAKEIAGGTVGRGKGDTGTGEAVRITFMNGTEGIATGVGRIIRGALTGAGNIVGGVLG
ncbi:hypothetical protein HNY73_002000 [Argiope bruennichi]|uniref:Uncharacterized protein n=1 Tax=Argiope bruennichi TaxID=94029 RepID=A0A8T0FTJ8_ARGBR|nr:hypothetical protein HNY73_002000 [Argiope bruennichi]